MKHSRYKVARYILLFWTLFIGISAVAGACGMFYDPSGKWMGMDKLLFYFQVLPFSDVLFQNYIFSGVSLLIVNGISNLLAFYLLLRNKKIGVILGGFFGVTLMLWICIQFYIFPINEMSIIYFFFGLIQALIGYAAWVFYKQESFCFDEKKYTKIGTNPEELVVYFSRMGYVKTVAYERANQLGADIYEIKSNERVKGTWGFWWCGRYGMHQWDMPIDSVDMDVSKYQHITICSPIWVFHLAAPVRTFCRQCSRKIKSASYILVHHQKNEYFNVVMEMDDLLGLKCLDYKSIQCKKGRYYD